MACNKRWIYGFTWARSRAVSCLQAAYAVLHCITLALLSIPVCAGATLNKLCALCNIQIVVSFTEMNASVSFCNALMRINADAYVCTFVHQSLNAFLHEQKQIKQTYAEGKKKKLHPLRICVPQHVGLGCITDIVASFFLKGTFLSSSVMLTG